MTDNRNFYADADRAAQALLDVAYDLVDARLREGVAYEDAESQARALLRDVGFDEEVAAEKIADYMTAETGVDDDEDEEGEG